eukprot:6914111-Karenia_brevis.AAC.1
MFTSAKLGHPPAAPQNFSILALKLTSLEAQLSKIIVVKAKLGQPPASPKIVAFTPSMRCIAIQ